MEYVYYDNELKKSSSNLPYLSLDYVSWKYIIKFINDIDNTFYKNHTVLYVSQMLYIRTSHIIKEPYNRFACCYFVAGKLLEDLIFHIEEFVSVTKTNKDQLLKGEKQIIDFIFKSDFCIFKELLKKYHMDNFALESFQEHSSKNISENLIKELSEELSEELPEELQNNENTNVGNYKGCHPSCFIIFPKMLERL